ncbi:MAG TPA: TetR/AcrR family transcriptional regulator [Galbitalea sp.]|jgi:AcrR family transcriptional regulator
MMPLDLAEPAARLGRPLDASRDTDILDATLDVLAEVGYDGMTVDMVAARAKAGKATVYRRWPSKTELVIDAVACMKNNDLALTDLPDTGTLRGDLIAMIKPPTMQDAERKLKVMAGLVSLLTRNPELADAANEAIVAPRAAINRTLMQRAIDRGEIPATANLDLLSTLSPALVSYRTLMLRKPVDRAFLISIIDNVVLPAARGTAQV